MGADSKTLSIRPSNLTKRMQNHYDQFGGNRLRVSHLFTTDGLTMDAKVVYEGNGEAHAALRKFRFVDQTDRSREAATACQTIVRSHVMTEVRRQKRSKVKLDKEADSNLMAFASEWSGTNSYKTWEGTHQLPPSRSDRASWQDPPSTLDHILDAVSYLAEPFPAQLMNSGGWDTARVTGDETGDFQYASDLQAVQSTSSWPSGIPSTVLETHTLKLDLAWAENAYSEAVAVDADAKQHVPMHRHRSDHAGEALPGRDTATIISPTILGRSRVDPFRALPIPADRDVYQLVDHCKFVRSRRLLAPIFRDFQKPCPDNKPQTPSQSHS